MPRDWLEVLVILALGALLLFWVHPWKRDRRRPLLWPRRSGNGLECEVIPRPDATSQELKQLATVLERWIAANAVPAVTTAYALADLGEGELPQPLSVAFERYLDDQLGRHGVPAPSGPERVLRHRQILTKLGSSAVSRTVFLRVHDANRAIASLRQAVPADLVTDILIDRRSWDLAD